MTPEGWKVKSLGELLDLSSGKRPTVLNEGSVPVYGGNGLMGRTVEPLRTDSTVVIGRVGSAGTVHTTSGPAWVSDNALYVKELAEDLIFDFLPWLLDFACLGQYATRSSHPSLSQQAILRVRVSLPPQPEQRKIAAILTSVDDAIMATRKVIEQTKRVKQGLLHTLMTRGIGHTRFKKTEIGGIPEAWEESVVEEHFDTQLGKMLNKKARTGPNQLPYVGNAQVQWTRVDLSDVSRMHFEESERQKFSLRKGDLLVCEGGEIGRSALWMGEIKDCYFQKAIHRLRPRGWYVPAFFLRYMMFAVGTGRFAGYSAKTSISHLTQEKLRRMPIPVPPRSEQEEISAVFDAVDEEIECHYAGARAMSSLKRGLMQDLLTGRARVPLD